MNTLDLNALSQFSVLARRLNFRRAAAELNVAPSSLSESIRALEDSLGVRLLNRTTRSAALTDAGKKLLESISGALDTLQNAAKTVAQNDGVAGTIRINGSRPAIELALMPLVTRFLSEHPEVKFELMVEPALVDIVAQGFDAGLRYDETLARDMVAIRVTPTQRMLIVGSPRYLARHGTPKHPKDLSMHNCIAHVFPSGALLPWSLEKGRQHFEFKPSGRLVTNDLGAQLQAARAGEGLTYLFEDYVVQDLVSKRLIPVLELWTPSFPGPSLYYPGRRLLPPAFRAFVDFAKRAPAD